MLSRPKRSELKALDRRLAKGSGKLYHRVLAIACVQYARLSGDTKFLGLLRSRDYAKLLDAADALVGRSYPTADLHFAAHQLYALISKYPWDPTQVGTRPEEAARLNFLSAERRCGKMNRKLRILRALVKAGKPLSPRARELWGLLHRMREWIRYVIGDEPDYSSIWDKCDFTGGANVGVTGDLTHLGRKLTAEKWTCTPGALELSVACLTHNHRFATRVAKRKGVVQSLGVDFSDLMRAIKTVTHEQIAFVPKKAKIHRVIAKQPVLNGLLQKGIDEEWRVFLRRVGLDLRDQKANQEMARKGSLPGSADDFCTIDLKNASDSVFTELCKEVLPPAWFVFLNRVRCSSFAFPGEAERPLEKMCAMGNGYCFPLETLLFAAICQATKVGKAGVDYRVYGDDIIVRKEFFSPVLRHLKRLGFVPNNKKTFGAGPFRESCGGNWYSGEDVTPCTLDYPLNSLERLFTFVNQARRNPRTTRFLSEAIAMVISAIPDRFQFWRPFKGAPGTGIDPLDVQITRRTVTPLSTNFGWSRKLQCKTWLELQTSPVKDSSRYPDWVVHTALLKGMGKRVSGPKTYPDAKTPFPCEDTALFTFRRKTVTRVRRVGRSGDLGPSDFNLAALSAARRPLFTFRLIRRR